MKERYLEPGQTDKERYQHFLAREQAKRGRLLGWFWANMLTAWARITENELGEPLEPGEPRNIRRIEEIIRRAEGIADVEQALRQHDESLN